MNSTEKLNLPSRLREKAFRQYESVITQAVKTFPDCIQVTPDGSAITYASRLRDAMLSLFRYRWTPTSVDMEKFLSIYSDDLKARKIHVSHQESDIVVGGGITDEILEKDDLTLVRQSAETWVTATSSEVEIICKLAHARMLTKPATVRMSEADALRLEQSYDVRIDSNGDGTYTII